MGLLTDRVAILTGGAGNLGSHMSRLLAAEGAKVVINDFNSAAADALAKEIEDAGGHAVADSSDVATLAGGRAIVERAVDAFGTVDILVLLAGQFTIKDFVDLTEEEWDAVIGVHLKGHFTVLHSAAPIMMAKNYGRVIAVSSCNGTIGDSLMAPYCAAKAGILGLARAAAIELDPHGICVNTICPAGGPATTGPVSAKLVGPSEGNAPLVAYLASEEAGWINGHVFDVAGSGRIGLYPPLIPTRVVEQTGGFDLDQVRKAVPAMFGPTYTVEPRQRPRLVPRSGDEQFTPGPSALLAEALEAAGLAPASG
jgi:NAD(P)-dependent dehydrogenase (short-subunit alcohol dehydrogenase family)